MACFLPPKTQCRGKSNDTVSAAHELDSQIDSVLKVVRQNPHEPSRHHPVQTGQSDTAVVTVALKYLEETKYSILN